MLMRRVGADGRMVVYLFGTSLVSNVHRWTSWHGGPPGSSLGYEPKRWSRVYALRGPLRFEG